MIDSIKNWCDSINYIILLRFTCKETKTLLYLRNVFGAYVHNYLHERACAPYFDRNAELLCSLLKGRIEIQCNHRYNIVSVIALGPKILSLMACLWDMKDPYLVAQMCVNGGNHFLPNR